MDNNNPIKDLELYSTIAFDGNTIGGLHCHPDGIHIVFPMGNTLYIQNWKTKKLDLLSGHSNIITAVAISSKGTYLGSGQMHQLGFNALVILWDYKKRSILSKHEMHKVRVESISFSCDESFMISIGGRDCGKILVWDNKSSDVHCLAAAVRDNSGDAMIVSSLHRRKNSFITAGDGNLRAWNIDLVNRSISVFDVNLGKLKRCILCIVISEDDSYGYCGTTSGDIIKLSIGYDSNHNKVPSRPPSMIGCYAKCGVWKKNSTRPETVYYCSGVQSILILNEELIVVGGGDGTVDCLKEIKRKTELPKDKLCSPTSPNLKAIKTTKLNGGITSIQSMEVDTKNGKEKVLLIGTKANEMYLVNLKSFQATLLVTSHSSPITEIAFPKNMSDVFATAGRGTIRLWALKSCQELLRIQVANFICTSIIFAANGKSIVSAWNDGCIRAFTPLSGQLMYCILNAHTKGPSAIAMTDDGSTIISGGCEGQIRVWSIKPEKQKLQAILKEHKCPVADIMINNTNTEAVSAGTDGSCIIWDIINLCRRQMLLAPTVFKCVCYEPSGCQILTGGSDRKVAYWEAGSGRAIREVVASKVGAVNSIDINGNGKYFVTGDDNQDVKLWKYDEGIYTHIGLGRSSVITAVKITPDNNYIVTGGDSGAIFIWKFPKEYLQPPSSSVRSERSSMKFKPTEKKDEDISTMDTSRSSIVAVCPCTQREKLSATNEKHGDGIRD